MSPDRSENDGEAGPSRPSGPLDGILGALDTVTRLAYRLSALLLGAIVLIYCTEIVLRYFFLSPTIWAHDSVTYLLCAMLFLAAPDVARTNSHIAVTLILERSSETVRHRIERVLWSVSAVIVLIVAAITFQDVLRLYTSNILTLGTVAVPKWWIAAFIPLGLVLVGLQFLSLAIAPERHRIKALKF